MSVSSSGLFEQLSLDGLLPASAKPEADNRQSLNENEIPAGEPPADPLEIPSARELAPMLQLYLRFKQQHPQHIILFQVGDFYEIFFEDAARVSQALNIRLTSRDKGDPNPIPMCGVPIHAIDSYLPKLLTAGLSCVIVSQVEESKNKKGLVQREITRIITPGVRYEGDGLDEKQFNYLAAVLMNNRGSGAVAYTDVSIGVLRVQELESEFELADAIRRIQPAEILLPSLDEQVAIDRTEKWWRETRRLSQENGWMLSLRPFQRTKREDFCTQLENLLPPAGVRQGPPVAEQIGTLSREALQVLQAILGYVEEVSFGKPPRLSLFSVEEASRVAFIDSATRRNLEITQARIDGDRRHSLLAYIDIAKTAMGSRTLADWLLAPSSDLEEICRRHDAVEECMAKPELLSRIRTLLAEVRDIDRLISRIVGFRAVPRDLGVFRDSLVVFQELGEILGNFTCDFFRELAQQFDPLSDILLELQRALVVDPPIRVSDGGIFREGYHAEVDRLRAVGNEGQQCLIQMEQRERQHTGISGLKVRYNNVFGYFIEITKTHLNKVPAEYQRKQTLANAERFVTEELKTFELSLLSAQARQLELERELFAALRNSICEHVGRIQTSSRVLATLDVLAAFAELARRHNYCRPTMESSQELCIVDGRHPVVEQVLGAHNFVPNDTRLNAAARRFAVLSGPNMGGKSTYLRQVGLIQLLAQAGSFVPATSATLGIVDRIFTRIGASDDLARGDSTFMVEMREAAVIAKRATERSLVLIDEIGRGTATHDGLAIATALAEWLHDVVKCRTLFATHFHELTLLPERKPSAFCLSVGVVEQGTDLVFTHRIEERAADKSFGVEVAKLAGLPEALVRRAKELLDEFLREEGKPVERMASNIEAELVPAPTVPRNLLQIEKRLLGLRTDSLTPLQALVELSELRQILEGE